MTTRFTDDIFVPGNVAYTGVLNPDVARSNLATDSLAYFYIPWYAWRIWDNIANSLGTASSDDLGLVGGTFGTGSPSIQTSDQKVNGAVTTQYARTFLCLPECYVEATNPTLEFHTGMITTIADTSATIDVEAYLINKETGLTGGDLISTAAQSINSLTFADKSFTANGASLTRQAILDIRVAIAIRDNASGTAVKGCFGSAALRASIKG